MGTLLITSTKASTKELIYDVRFRYYKAREAIGLCIIKSILLLNLKFIDLVIQAFIEC